MSKRRSQWTAIPRTPARYAYRCVERDGVAILCVRLSGHAENNPDGVSRVKKAIDELASSIASEPDVATLDVTAFSNADDDACSILTHVLEGLPCCWITHHWDQQFEGRRWDLPPSERMAPTGEDAIARVVSWRRAGGFSIPSSGGSCTREWQWTERGLVVRDTGGGALDCEDVFHRNRLVERTLHGDRPVRVLWPFVDRTGAAHEAVRRRARLVFSGGRVVEADFSPWSTGRPLPDDWVESIAGLTSLNTLVLRRTSAREGDILRAVRALPALVTLEVDPGALTPEVRAQLRRERPSLVLR